ncbi:MAG: cyclic nucleotide-binding and patatin-like phospholipase domain-containing protein, partial [Myxococcota bacterium]|nr:cyclic nucleotide-binding and patatin-like phospholipase domain-containing protein [Myxococcota bacterium]
MSYDFERLRGFLQLVPLLHPLPDHLQDEVAQRTEQVHLQASRWLFRKGDEGDSLFVIQSGLVEVIDERGAKQVVLRVLGRGEFFGELSLLTGAPRSASIRALRDCEFLRIRRDDFSALLVQHPEVLLGIARQLGQRLQNPARSGKGVRTYLGVLTVLPLHREVAPVFDEVTASLGRLTEVGSLTRSSMGDVDESAGDASFGRALDALERAKDLVVVRAEVEDMQGAWTRFCVRQADRTLVVVQADRAPQDLEGIEEGCDLALVGDSPSLEQIRAWMEALKPRSHFFIRTGGSRARDLEAMCRRLVGASVGVVLCGGGARALAHLGAMKALEESQVPIDRVGGVSMGAFVGSLWASGRSHAEIREVVVRELVEANPFNDYTFPIHALIRSRKARQMMERIWGDTHIEQL